MHFPLESLCIERRTFDPLHESSLATFSLRTSSQTGHASKPARPANTTALRGQNRRVGEDSRRGYRCAGTAGAPADGRPRAGCDSSVGGGAGKGRARRFAPKPRRESRWSGAAAVPTGLPARGRLDRSDSDSDSESDSDRGRRWAARDSDQSRPAGAIRGALMRSRPGSCAQPAVPDRLGRPPPGAPQPSGARAGPRCRPSGSGHEDGRGRGRRAGGAGQAAVKAVGHSANSPASPLTETSTPHAPGASCGVVKDTASADTASPSTTTSSSPSIRSRTRVRPRSTKPVPDTCANAARTRHKTQDTRTHTRTHSPDNTRLLSPAAGQYGHGGGGVGGWMVVVAGGGGGPDRDGGRGAALGRLGGLEVRDCRHRKTALTERVKHSLRG